MNYLTMIFLMLLIPDVKAQNLFSDDQQMDLTPQQQKILTQLKNQKQNITVQTVMINSDVFDKTSFQINMPQKNLMQAHGQSFTRKGDDIDRWLGKLSAGADKVSFVINGNNITGLIHHADQIYSVVPIGGGAHAVIEKNVSEFPEEHPSEPFQLEDNLEDSNKPSSDNQDESSEQSMQDQQPTHIHETSVMVIYTKKITEYMADPQSFIELAIELSNDSFKAHKLEGRLKLVKTHQVDYTEQGNISVDLRHLVKPTDGVMDDIHQMRNNSQADLVVLLTNSQNYCGQAANIMATENTAFAVVYHDCSNANLSFPHELGHLYGARHNKQVDSNSQPYVYGHGYYLNSLRKRSIMSYDCPNGCKRIPYWSDPTMNFENQPFGEQGSSNNVLVLKQTFPIISRFR